MAKLSLVILCSALLISGVMSESLQLGNFTNSVLVYVEDVSLSSVPLKTRTKNVFYNDENTVPRVIKAISALDRDQSKAKATVTSGGVGSTFANVRIKSERGDGINYQVQFFV